MEYDFKHYQNNQLLEVPLSYKISALLQGLIKKLKSKP